MGNKKFRTRNSLTISEGIAYGEVVAEGLAEAWHIVVAALACVVRRMNADTEVETNDEEVEVVAKANACAESYLVAKMLERELSPRLTLAIAQKPDIACIKERCALQLADNGEAILHVCLKFEVAHLVNV